jgi:acetolactate synthase regulatory subunit
MTRLPDAAPTAVTSTIVVALHDRHGSLERVLGAVRRQACMVTNLALEPANEPGVMVVTLTMVGAVPTRLVQQIRRLVDVLEVHADTPSARREVPSDADIAQTPFRSQADGVSLPEGDSASPRTLMED